MKTNYLGHDAAYIARKSKGFPGWADEVTLQRNIATLEREFFAVSETAFSRVIELGCGAGDISIWLKRRGFEVAGIDCSPTAIEWAREKAADLKLEINFNVGSVLDLASFQNQSADLVVDGHCLHCIIGRDRQSLLQSVLRVLRPEGRFFVKTMCGDLRDGHLNINAALMDTFDPATRCLMTDDGVATRYIGLPETIVDEIADAGFDIDTYRVNPSKGVSNSMDELLLWARKPS